MLLDVLTIHILLLDEITHAGIDAGETGREGVELLFERVAEFRSLLLLFVGFADGFLGQGVDDVHSLAECLETLLDLVELCCAGGDKVVVDRLLLI